MGFWVKITNPTVLTIYGTEPVTTNINLYTGWNLVGYPSDTLVAASATLPAQADMISLFNASQPYLIQDTTDFASTTMTEGEAYWVHVTSDCVWTVNW